MAGESGSNYARIVERIFLARYVPGDRVVEFEREDIAAAAQELGLPTPRNLGDVLYSFKFRSELPASILEKAPAGMVWVIEGTGPARYRFRLGRLSRVRPNLALRAIKVPDATPQAVVRYATGDEQALLAKLRYNRLIDLFLGITTYSLQNHLRSSVRSIGQIEIDELYVGIDKQGRHYIVPVQAKGGSDELSAVQMTQDIAFCRQQFPDLICRPIAAQFISGDEIALFELSEDDEREMSVVEERHYKLVPTEGLAADEVRSYNSRP